MNANEKLTADLRHVEEILDRAKAELMNLLPEGPEPLPDAPAKRGGPDAPPVAAGQTHAPFVERNRLGWLPFITRRN